MKLKWYGHASFRITASDGISVITDPYTPDVVGYKPILETADIVIISSDNDSSHCRVDLIPGSPITVNALELAQSGGTSVVNGIPISAIQAMEALDHPEHDPDQNGMYRFVVDGVSIGHMGDVGNSLNEAQVDFFRGVDVLLALAGGLPTIGLDDLKTLIDETRPPLIVPMHFRTLTYKPRNTLWIASFLSYFKDDRVDFACSEEVEISRESPPGSSRVLVLDYV